MDLHFLGGATTVTGSQYLLETGRARVLIDCGMFQGSPNEAMRNRVPLAYDPATLDIVLLTHAHLDHCGLIPHLVKEGYRGRIIATAGTCELAELVLLDSGKLQQEFAKREARWEKKHPDRVARGRPQGAGRRTRRRSTSPPAGSPRRRSTSASTTRPPPLDAAARPPESATRSRRPAVSEEVPAPTDAVCQAGRALRAPPPPDRDLEADLRGQPAGGPDRPRPAALRRRRRRRPRVEHFDAIGYDEEREVAPGVHATYLDAGHILGSAIIRLRIEAGGAARAGPSARRRSSSRATSAGRRRRSSATRSILTAADYLLVESTYGGREHEPEDEAIRILAETVHMVSDAGGVLLVPSFAIGRTQEIVYALDRLLEAGKIPELPLYLDSPMASKASDIYRRHAEYFDDGHAARCSSRATRRSTTRTRPRPATSTTRRRSPRPRGRT